MTTMELSTSMPTDTARPDREIMLMVTPEKNMRTIVNTTLIGMETSVMKVGRTSRRKISRTRIAKIAP